jgi:hypothetical protein
MAGIIFLVLFFALGGLLVYLVHYGLAREDERWGLHSEDTLLEEPSAPTQQHDRAA